MRGLWRSRIEGVLIHVLCHLFSVRINLCVRMPKTYLLRYERVSFHMWFGSFDIE